MGEEKQENEELDVIRINTITEGITLKNETRRTLIEVIHHKAKNRALRDTKNSKKVKEKNEIQQNRIGWRN